jgi:hypothetical protein
MRKYPLISITLLGLTLSFGLAACDGGGGEGADSADSTTNDPGDGDPTTGDGDTTDPTDGCIEAPEICLRMVNCIGAILPSQSEDIEAQYGEDGSCWCNGVDAANECFTFCTNQVDTAIKNYPTESACHASVCSLDELDPDQPYGPIQGASCPEWNGLTQIPASNLFGTPGSFCSPECPGIAKNCPQHPQTAAAGSCYFSSGGKDHCVLRCWVDPTIIGGTQCHCGARCQPHGPPDGEGNQRGICTFE